MNTLTEVEKTLLIKNLLELLHVVDLDLCPGFVGEVLRLCDKVRFDWICTAPQHFPTVNLAPNGI